MCKARKHAKFSDNDIMRDFLSQEGFTHTE